MPQSIKMKIKLHVIICLVSAVGRATVSVMSLSVQTEVRLLVHFFLPQNSQLFDRFYAYMNMRSNILFHCDQKIQKEKRIEIKNKYIL